MLAATVLFSLLAAASTSPGQCAPAVSCSASDMPAAGDADCNGTIDATDLDAITQRLFCVMCGECAHPIASDTNFDDVLSVADVTGLFFLALAATATPTNTNTATTTTTLSPTASSTPSQTASATHMPTNTGTPTATATPPPMATPTPSRTASATRTPTSTGTPTATPTSTHTPTITPTRTPTTLACTGGLNEAVFPIAVDVHDATVRRNGTSYPPAGNFVLNSFERDGLTQRSLGTQFTTGNTLFRWRTSTQPNGVPWPLDVAVASAHLRAFFGIGGIVNDDDRAFVTEWYDLQQLGTEDWSNDAPLGDAPSFAGAIPIGEIEGGYRTIQLTNVERIQLDGFTGLRTHIRGPLPSGRNQVEIRTFEHGSTPAQLVICWTGTLSAPTATPTSTATPVPPQPRLALGQIQVLSIPTPAPEPYEYRLAVTCPEVEEDEEISLFVGDPIDADLRGTIVFASGFTGTFRWSAYSAGNARVVSELRQAGFRTVELRWERNWFRGSANGHHRFACRPATVARWIYDNLHMPGSQQPFCAEGHSNGASQVAYMLARYGLGDILSLAVLEGGPNWSRLDHGCIWDTPSVQHLWWAREEREIIDFGFGSSDNGFGPCAQQRGDFRALFRDASIAADGLEHVLPRTLVAFVIGAQDGSTTAEHGRVYYDKLVAAGTPLVRLDIIPAAGHVTAATTQGADAIRDLFISECVPR